MNAPAVVAPDLGVVVGCQPELAEIVALRREAQPAQLAELAGLIRVELRAGIEHAVRAGSLLIDAKKVIDHGHWLPWIRDNFGLSERSAQNFMKLSRDMAALPAANAKRVALLPLREALASIAESRRPEAHKDPTGAMLASGKKTAPKPLAKIMLRAPAVTTKAPAATVHTADRGGDAGHGDEQVAGGGGGVDNVAVMPIADIKIPPVGYWRDRAEVQIQFKASLLDAWAESSDETRRWFMVFIFKHDLVPPLMDKKANKGKSTRRGAA
jgi:hypothetical protein